MSVTYEITKHNGSKAYFKRDYPAWHNSELTFVDFFLFLDQAGAQFRAAANDNLATAATWEDVNQ